MTRRQVAALAFAVSIALGLCHALCYSTLLPDQVVSKFALDGSPISWAARSTVIDLQLTIIVIIAAIFLVLAGTILKVPRRLFFLPHREFWLSHERIDHTRLDLAACLLWLGTITQICVLVLFHRSLSVSLGRTDSLAGYWFDLGIYLVLCLLWLGQLLLRYYRVPSTAR